MEAHEKQLFHAELYCENSRCAMREVEVRVKDYNREHLYDRLTPNLRCSWSCPACGTPLKVHWVMTRLEYRAYREREARMSVNTQRFERAHATPGERALVLVPASVMMDDSLPE